MAMLLELGAARRARRRSRTGCAAGEPPSGGGSRVARSTAPRGRRSTRSSATSVMSNQRLELLVVLEGGRLSTVTPPPTGPRCGPEPGRRHHRVCSGAATTLTGSGKSCLIIWVPFAANSSLNLLRLSAAPAKGARAARAGACSRSSTRARTSRRHRPDEEVDALTAFAVDHQRLRVELFVRGLGARCFTARSGGAAVVVGQAHQRHPPGARPRPTAPPTGRPCSSVGSIERP